MHQQTRTVRTLLASLTLATCGAAIGQTESEGGVRAPLAPPIPSVQGVKAQVPPPSGISRKGTLLNRTGTLLPPSPQPPRSGERGHQHRPMLTFPTARPDRDGRPIRIGNGYIGRPPLVTDQTGVVIDGNARGDHFNLRFHLGSGYTYVPHWRPWHYDRDHYRWDDHADHAHGSHRSHSSWWYPWRSYGYGGSGYGAGVG